MSRVPNGARAVNAVWSKRGYFAAAIKNICSAKAPI